MFDVCTMGDTAHIDMIFKLLPHANIVEYRIDVCRATRVAIGMCHVFMLTCTPILPTASQHKGMASTNCCVYRVVPPDDEQ
jgi:hypothetical protein